MELVSSFTSVRGAVHHVVPCLHIYGLMKPNARAPCQTIHIISFYITRSFLFFLPEDYYDRHDDGNKTESTAGRNSNGRPSPVLTPLDETGMTFSILYITIANEEFVM